ncbi:GDSL esterase/lipase [Rhynchospora pubera]|uniref:GDSL esterase/lipase n=1 Tax=Rhynchospora pubera TaxID=906938 RepID=A0AAV8FNR3_9POAL|nr:GDSL esterase/lipase [Rhynchospora pubera]
MIRPVKRVEKTRKSLKSLPFRKKNGIENHSVNRFINKTAHNFVSFTVPLQKIHMKRFEMRLKRSKRYDSVFCLPFCLRIRNISTYRCLKHYNTIGIYHNIKLQQAVFRLRIKYPKAEISYANYYEPVINFLKNPKNFGFTNGAPLRICCGGGGPYNYNLTATCGQPGVSACSKPSSYINWDGIHLTEAAYRIIATGWLEGPYAYPPILTGWN